MWGWEPRLEKVPVEGAILDHPLVVGIVNESAGARQCSVRPQHIRAILKFTSELPLHEKENLGSHIE